MKLVTQLRLKENLRYCISCVDSGPAMIGVRVAHGDFANRYGEPMYS